MLSKSWKYMLLTVAVGLLLLFGILFAVRMINTQRAERELAAMMTPTPEPTAEPTPEPTAVPSPTAEPTPTPTPAPVYSEQVMNALNTLTLEEKIGQLVMFGFDGVTKPDNDDLAFFSKYHVGGAILLEANIKDSDSDGGFSRAGKLTAALEENNTTGIPMLFSVDAEGGKVVRFTWRPSLPAASKLGESGDTEDAKARFTAAGQKLISAGISLDLAPVLDVSENPSKTYLGTRIISSDASVVSSIGSAIINGLHEGGCLATAKHFPGHGGTTLDSHTAVPVVNKTYEEMLSYDLAPFQAAIDAGVDCIMTAHIRYPELDMDNIATLSHTILTDLLRDEMGFDGVIISDDFRMTALQRSVSSSSEGAVQFILAGGDIILCGPDDDMQQEIMDALLAAAKDGTLTEERINESVARILTMKYRVQEWNAVEETPVPDVTETPAAN